MAPYMTAKLENWTKPTAEWFKDSLTFGFRREKPEITARKVLNTSLPQKEESKMAPYMTAKLENWTKPTAEWFKDSLMFGFRREKPVYLSIGIPCILRPHRDRYVVGTLNSLIKHSSQEEKEEMAIVLFLADTDPINRNKTADFLRAKYHTYITSGFIQLISAPKSFYPNLTNLKITYSQPKTKVRWRSKQNFDFAFNMLYSQSLAEYYLQLEDDVVTVPHYFQHIRKFIQARNKPWVCLEFSSLGFIAKLYHAYDLEKLAQTLMVFYNEQPNDVTYLYFNQIMFQRGRLIRKPTIFDHRGLHSSLRLKMNSLKDPFFKANPKDLEDDDPDIQVIPPQSNRPPANIMSSFRSYEKYTLQTFYSNDSDIYWCRDVKKGDFFTIVFDTPQNISNISLTTGHQDFPDDVLKSGKLQIGLTGNTSSSDTDCSDIARTEIFSEGRVVMSNISKNSRIACVRLEVTGSQSNWMIISEFSFSYHTS